MQEKQVEEFAPLLAFLKRYRELMLVVALLLFPAGTFIANAKQGRDLSGLDRLCLAASAPIASAVDGLVGGSIDAWNGYADLRGIREENLKLKGELLAARDELREVREAELENGRLRELLSFAEVERGK